MGSSTGRVRTRVLDVARDVNPLAARASEPVGADRNSVASWDAVVGSVEELAFDAEGCRLLQATFEALSTREVGQLMAEMRGRIREAVACPYANHVVQKGIMLCSKQDVHFTAEELLGATAATARNRYGCRILCRLLEHCGPTAVGIDEIVSELRQLSRHSYGCHVVRSVIEHGSTLVRRRITTGVLTEATSLARHRYGHGVVLSILACCDDDDRRAIAAEVLSSSSLLDTAMHQFGCSVVDAALHLPDVVIRELKMASAEQIQTSVSTLRANKRGRRILQSMGVDILAESSDNIANP